MDLNIILICQLVDALRFANALLAIDGFEYRSELAIG